MVSLFWEHNMVSCWKYLNIWEFWVQFSPTSEHILLAYGRRHGSLLRSIVSDGETTSHFFTVLEVKPYATSTSMFRTWRYNTELVCVGRSDIQSFRYGACESTAKFRGWSERCVFSSFSWRRSCLWDKGKPYWIRSLSINNVRFGNLIIIDSWLMFFFRRRGNWGSSSTIQLLPQTSQDQTPNLR